MHSLIPGNSVLSTGIERLFPKPSIPNITREKWTVPTQLWLNLKHDNVVLLTLSSHLFFPVARLITSIFCRLLCCQLDFLGAIVPKMRSFDKSSTDGEKDRFFASQPRSIDPHSPWNEIRVVKRYSIYHCRSVKNHSKMWSMNLECAMLSGWQLVIKWIKRLFPKQSAIRIPDPSIISVVDRNLQPGWLSHLT